MKKVDKIKELERRIEELERRLVLPTYQPIIVNPPFSNSSGFRCKGCGQMIYPGENHICITC